ncbi:hypothetical protein OH146_00265 [Salinibacterium sp. SYSU T00001]|uniref:sodium:calcium antiporter n=1 Tax=Homoserinimonas sedimenticola TaxID=2986805 RepID=UPI00223585DB|nr:hypothetical protein [Salinibacterium sedimenticola]MCW4384204.1 hypothetical protein [Salinibacterium sedimenticola]
MSAWALWPSILALAASVVVLVFAGSRLARTADQLSDRTGMGKAAAGALFLGAVTSLPGIIATATGALEGDAAYALANPLGGVAVQTVWLAIADLVYRKANLEHASASLENLLQSLVLVALISMPVVAYATPGLTLGWVHPITLVMPVVYLYGLSLLNQARKEPMWSAKKTSDTREGGEAAGTKASTPQLWLRLGMLAVVVGVTGWVIAQAGLGIVAATGWPSGITGFTVTTAVTSLPELVTLIAAVRMGALTLGVGNIIGGNVFDTLLIIVADGFYTEGNIYSSAGAESLVLLGGTVLITSVLAAGLLVRQRKGVGFESVAIPGVYLGTVALAIFAS